MVTLETTAFRPRASGTPQRKRCPISTRVGISLPSASMIYAFTLKQVAIPHLAQSLPGEGFIPTEKMPGKELWPCNVGSETNPGATSATHVVGRRCGWIHVPPAWIRAR